MFNPISTHSSRSFFPGEQATPSTSIEVVPIEVHNELAYLTASAQNPVADRIDSEEQREQARRDVEVVFRKDYLSNCELDMEEELRQYNRAGAHERVTFLE